MFHQDRYVDDESFPSAGHGILSIKKIYQLD